MTAEGFLTYLILLIWGPIGICALIGLGFGIFIHWASKRFQ